MFDSMREALDRAAAEGLSLGELALRAEAESGLRTRAEVEAALRRALEVMRGAVGRGREGDPQGHAEDHRRNRAGRRARRSRGADRPSAHTCCKSA